MHATSEGMLYVVPARPGWINRWLLPPTRPMPAVQAGPGVPEKLDALRDEVQSGARDNASLKATALATVRLPCQF